MTHALPSAPILRSTSSLFVGPPLSIVNRNDDLCREKLVLGSRDSTMLRESKMTSPTMNKKEKVHRVGTKIASSTATTTKTTTRMTMPSTTTTTTMTQRRVTRRVTNEGVGNATVHSQQQQQTASVPSQSSRQQPSPTAASITATVSRSNSSTNVGIHDYAILDPSYQPNEYDVIIDPSHHHTTATSSEFYDEYLLPSYMEMIREGKYHDKGQYHILLLDLIDAVESNGGRYVRRHHDRWIQVSPMMARMYNWHRLRSATTSSSLTNDHDDDSVTKAEQQQNNDGMEQQQQQQHYDYDVVEER